MAFSDRLIPIILDVNDVPSEVNEDNYPNASLLIEKYNELLTDVLPFTSSGGAPGQGPSYIVHREQYTLSQSGITLYLDTSLLFSTTTTFHTAANLVGFLNNKIFHESINLVINTSVHLGTFIINSLFVNSDDVLTISKADQDLDVSFSYLSSSLRIKFDYYFINKRPPYEDPFYGSVPAQNTIFNCASTHITFQAGYSVTAYHYYDRCTVLYLEEARCSSTWRLYKCNVTFKDIDDTGAITSYFPYGDIYGGSLTFEGCNLDVQKSSSISVYDCNVYITNSSFIKSGNSGVNTTWNIFINNSTIMAINSIFTRVNLSTFNIGSKIYNCVGYFKGCTGGQTISSNNYIYLINA